MRCSAISYRASTEKRCLRLSLSSSLIYLFIKCPRLFTSATFQLHIQMNFSLVQTNPCLKSHVRVTREMSQNGDEKYLETLLNIQIHFTSVLHHLTVGLRFDLLVRCKEGLSSGLSTIVKRLLGYFCNMWPIVIAYKSHSSLCFRNFTTYQPIRMSRGSLILIINSTFILN